MRSLISRIKAMFEISDYGSLPVWPEFATLAKFLKYLVIFQGFIKYLANFLTYFGIFCGGDIFIKRNGQILGKKNSIRSWCYKTIFGGNLDFPKIKKLKNICFDVRICTIMWKQCYFQAKPS